MKTKIFYFFSFISMLTCFAQQRNFNQDLNVQTLLMAPSSSIYTFDKKNNSIEGTPYMNDGDFETARVHAADTIIYSARYNMLNDEIEIKTDNNEIQVLNKDVSDLHITFVTNNKTLRPFKYVNDEGLIKTGYFSNLTILNHEYVLLLKIGKEFVEGKESKNSYLPSKAPKFKLKKDEFLLLKNDQEAITIPSKRKRFLMLFPNNEKSISDFIRENNVKLNNQGDLTKLIVYINTL